MTANMGNADRLARLIVGLILIVLPLVNGMAIFGMAWLSYLMIIAGIVLVATSALGFCPLYKILGIQTLKA